MQNKEIKASADVFLSEVRKKLSDVKKSTDLLNALQKLRKIRKDFAEKQGILHIKWAVCQCFFGEELCVLGGRGVFFIFVFYLYIIHPINP